MPDVMDTIQERQLREEAEIVANRPKPVVGLTRCSRADCGEPIAPQRTALGARLCMECQQEQDARDAHIRHWSRR
jgi:RNA polymerase-binding transcription factor DksA